jgi:hypothetical protein
MKRSQSEKTLQNKKQKVTETLLERKRVGVCIPLNVAELIIKYTMSLSGRTRRLVRLRGISKSFAVTIPPQIPTTLPKTLEHISSHPLFTTDTNTFLIFGLHLRCGSWDLKSHGKCIKTLCKVKQWKYAKSIWKALYISRYPRWSAEEEKRRVRQVGLVEKKKRRSLHCKHNSSETPALETTENAIQPIIPETTSDCLVM